MIRIKRLSRQHIAAALMAALAAWGIIGQVNRLELIAQPEPSHLKATGYPQLIAVQPLPSLPETNGAMCPVLSASLQEPSAPLRTISTNSDGARTKDAGRSPVRVIRDTYPTYSAVGVDANSNEVFLQDENLFGIKVFNRTDNTPPGALFTEPKRVLGGLLTKLEFNCALYIDPKSGDIYSVNNDTVDTMTVFPRDAKGNVKPMRALHTPHRAYGVAVDEEAQELYLTVEHPPEIDVYRKTANGEDKPLRTLKGENTHLADAHGIAIDTKNGWMFVSNHGSASTSGTKGGWFDPPSITVYPLKATGDTAPVRTIAGPKTQLNWPAHVYVDGEHGELYVANDGGDSILVFRETDNGDAVPTRTVKGNQTGLRSPTSLFVDTRNNELFVSNMGNHSATVYPRTASGDVAPIRTIRSAPQGKQAEMIGNPGAAAYDSKREEILVPN
jgi:6-phosphogluconolactonase (cycloisomerase 2 family)